MSTNPPEKHDGRRSNAIKTGKRMRQPPPRMGTIGSLGPGRGHVVVSLRGTRDWLETVTIQRYGEISLLHAAYINTAVRNERTAQLSQLYLKENPDLPLADRLNLLRGIGAASEARDRAIEKLKIEQTPADLWRSIYAAPLPATTPSASPPAADEPTHVEPAEIASGASVGDDAAASTEGNE
jgi:hypothetical protein